MSSIRFVEVSSAQNRKNNSWVLVFLVGSLGDTIVCLPALEAIRRQFPDDKIILLHDYQTLVPISPLDIVPKSLVDGGLSYVMHSEPVAKIREMYKLRQRIRQENVKAVVYLISTERFGLPVWRDKLFFKLCGIKNLIGFYSFEKSELYERDENNQPLMKTREPLRKLERLERDGVNVENLNLTGALLEFSAAEKKKVELWLAAHRQKPGARLVAICPGCKMQANRWNVDNYIEIGRRLIEADNFEIVIIGGKAEKQLAQTMIDEWGCGIDATGEFTPNESGILFTHCEFMIGNDTGTTHLAAVAGIPCLAVYGQRNNPGHWFPLGSGHLIIQHEVECAGCRLTECARPGHPCLTEIEVNKVWELLKTFISDKRIQRDAFERVLV
jgi:ADP-heptose:LPS heptosyltransferase